MSLKVILKAVKAAVVSGGDFPITNLPTSNGWRAVARLSGRLKVQARPERPGQWLQFHIHEQKLVDAKTVFAVQVVGGNLHLIAT